MNIHNVRQATHALRALMDDPVDPFMGAKFLALTTMLREEMNTGPSTRIDDEPKSIGAWEKRVVEKLLAVADTLLAIYVGGENITGRKVRVFHSGMIIEGAAHERVGDLFTLGGCVLVDERGEIRDDRTVTPVTELNLASRDFERLELVPNDLPKTDQPITPIR